MEMQRGPWEDYARPATPRIVVPTQPAPRYPEQEQIQRGQAEAAPLEAPRVRSTIRNNEVGAQRTEQTITQSDTLGHNFTDEQAMRSRFEGLPDVRNYHAVLPVAEAARNANNRGSGALDLVYAFAKVMDPGSVVREGEVQMTENTGGLADRVRGLVQRAQTGSGLPPNVRAGLIQEINNRVEQYRAAYNQVRKNYFRNAERYGFDPDAAVGPDIADAYQAGPNAPVSAQAPGVGPPAPQSNQTALGAAANAMGGALGAAGLIPQAGPAAPLPAINAPGGVTATNAQESAQASQVAGQGAADTSGAAADPQMETGAARAYNEAWVQAVNSGLDRDQLNQWAVENAPRFFPRWTREAGPPAPMDDRLWNAIEESRRTGRGLDWVPPSIPVSQVAPVNVPGIGEVDLRPALRQQYQDNAANARGAEDRRAFAEEHPFLASIDTAGRQIADTVTLGTASRIAGTLSGRGAAYEHGITGEDWRSRPLESLGGTFAGGARMAYGSTLPRQIGAGAAYGGITDFNNTDGPINVRLSRGAQGAALGAGTNAIMGGAAAAYRSPNAQAILDAGERQGIVIPRYMTGRETAQVATGAVGATPGRIPLARVAERVIGGLRSARDRAASLIGDASDNITAGRRAQRGARTWLEQSEERGAEHFNRVPIAPQTEANLTNTRAVLAEATQGLESNPRLSALLEDPQLVRYRDALTQGGLSWGDMKQFRSTIGRMIGRAQIASEGTHVQDLRALYSGLTRDMEATAAAQGPRALTMFRRANQYWRGREARREGIITDILGRNNDAAPEDAYRQINRWAQQDTGDIGALSRTMRSLPRDDADAVRATIFARMGRATKGQQDEAGTAFSPRVFASQWDGLEPRARALLVPNAAHRRNLDDIALLARTMRNSERFTNTSNTGLGANFGAFTLGGWMTSPGAAAGAAASAYMLGRMLSSPSGSRTLLRALRDPAAFRGLLQDQENDQ